MPPQFFLVLRSNFLNGWPSGIWDGRTVSAGTGGNSARTAACAASTSSSYALGTYSYSTSSSSSSSESSGAAAFLALSVVLPPADWYVSRGEWV